jgi:hypothetical protein
MLSPLLMAAPGSDCRVKGGALEGLKGWVAVLPLFSRRVDLDVMKRVGVVGGEACETAPPRRVGGCNCWELELLRLWLMLDICLAAEGGLPVGLACRVDDLEITLVLLKALP